MSDPQRLVQRIEELPTLPQVALKIMQVVQDPNSSARDIEKVLSTDPGLAAKILRLVNSAFFGFSQKISSLGHAIVILGFNEVKNMALSLSVIDLFKRKAARQVEGLPMEDFWRHSVATATLARAAAADAEIDAELAFVGGLLHDVGKLVTELYAEQTMVAILELSQQDSISYVEAELRLEAGAGHAELGGLLVQHWGLDERLAAGIREHHAQEPPEEPLAALLAVADYVAWQEGFSVGQYGPGRPTAGLAALNLRELDLDRYRTLLAEEREAIESFLSAAQ